MESLNFLKFKNSLKLLSDVVSAMTESVDERNLGDQESENPKSIKPMVDRLKTAAELFSGLTSATTCTSYD
jgi:hypothetical protein